MLEAADDGGRRSPNPDQLLADYIRRHVYPYSTFYRARLDEAGLGAKVGSRADLRRLALTTFDEIVDPTELLLRPEESTIQRYGDPRLAWKVFWAKLTRNQSRINRSVLEPAYKPLHWHVAEGVPIGYSAEDLGRLADLGRRWLALAGLSRNDVVLGMLPAGPHLDYWELVLGCRRAGLSSLFLPPVPTAAQLEAAGANVLVGRPDDLVRALDSVVAASRRLDAVHTVLAVGEPLPLETRNRLRELSPNLPTAVVSAWAPPGVRALWSECRTGTTLHTWPDTEVIEVVGDTDGQATRHGEPGEVVWSGIGWKGTALLRLRTGTRAALENGPCQACGRVGPRLRPALPPPARRRRRDGGRRTHQ